MDLIFVTGKSSQNQATRHNKNFSKTAMRTGDRFPFSCRDGEIVMANNSSSSSGGIGFTGLLTILFIGLKLTGYIDWSWWWVLSPLWIAAVFVVIVLGVILAIAIVSTIKG